RRIGRAPALDRDLPDARLRVRGRTAVRIARRSARDGRAVAVVARVRVDRDAVGMEAQEARLARTGGRGRPGEVDLEGGRAGGDAEEEAPRLVPADRP